MRNVLLFLFIFIGFSLHSFSSVVFNDYFEKSAIRYDFELVGDKNEFKTVHKQTKFISNWGGNPTYLIDKLNYGSFRYQIYDANNNVLIFQKHMSLLASEWQETAEAKLEQKSFYQAIFFPRPKSDVRIVFQSRDEKNNWHTFYNDTIKLNDYFIINENAKPFELDTLIYNGNCSEKVDLVLISEGYQSAEMEKFVSDSKRLSEYLFSAEPFLEYSNRFNVYLLKVPSVDSGTDVPGEYVFKNTAFNSNFYTFDSPRYLTTYDMKAVYDAVDGLAWDQLYLIVNEERYGGGGFYNLLNVCTSDNERSPLVFIHEFGHGFAGLGDEYYESSTSYESFYNVVVEPWEPNLTALVNFESKWKNSVEKDIPVPTPRDSIYLNKVGAFEGGGYVAKGIYSPSMTCWMKELSADGFCPVCCEAIKKVILLQTE